MQGVALEKLASMFTSKKKKMQPAIFFLVSSFPLIMSKQDGDFRPKKRLGIP
jgi:hypothetical protein